MLAENIHTYIHVNEDERFFIDPFSWYYILYTLWMCRARHIDLCSKSER